MKTLREKIINELKKQNLGSGNNWTFQQRRNFVDNLNPVEKKNIIIELNKMIDEGYFVTFENNDYAPLRLTEKCEKEIWGK